MSLSIYSRHVCLAELSSSMFSICFILRSCNRLDFFSFWELEVSKCSWTPILFTRRPFRRNANSGDISPVVILCRPRGNNMMSCRSIEIESLRTSRSIYYNWQQTRQPRCYRHGKLSLQWETTFMRLWGPVHYWLLVVSAAEVNYASAGDGVAILAARFKSTPSGTLKLWIGRIWKRCSVLFEFPFPAYT